VLHDNSLRRFPPQGSRAIVTFTSFGGKRVTSCGPTFSTRVSQAASSNRGTA
jgi:hypothetical protein